MHIRNLRLLIAALAAVALASPNAIPVAWPYAAPAPVPRPAPQAPASPPAECAMTYNNGQPFQLGIVNASSSSSSSSKRKRQTSPSPTNATKKGTTLMLTLLSGTLLDQNNRKGYISSTDQLQFNTPIQSTALYTSGFSVCSNGTLALLGAVWWECLSGDFFNIYTTPVEGGVCYPAFLQALGDDGAVATQGVSTAARVSGTATVVTLATPTGDIAPNSQAPDGQPQTTTSAALSSTVVTAGLGTQTTAGATATTGSPGEQTVLTQGGATMTMSLVTQIGDGQVQAPAPYRTAGGRGAVTTVDGTVSAVTANASATGRLVPFVPGNAAGALGARVWHLLCGLGGAVVVGTLLV